MTRIPFLSILSIILFTGCIKKDVNSAGIDPVSAEQQNMDNMQVNSNFTFNTTNKIDLQISTLDNADKPVPGIRINIYTDYPENSGSLIMSCFTGSNGIFNGTLPIATFTDSVVFETSAIGFVQLQKRKITNNTLHCILGGKNPELNGLAGNMHEGPAMGTPMGTAGVEGLPVIKAIGTFNALGVPNYLSLPNDVVDASFLADINTALPEYKPVPTFHPQYLLQTNQANLTFQQSSQVWVTFVHEGAGYKNVLCYYKYNVNNPPATAADIDTLHAIFPNTSYINSGGGLVSGNKVEIGTFQPGTAVGWALIANGYNGSAITTGAGIYFSDASLNPETTTSLKKHCIMLNDVNREKFLVSFEDLNRQNSGCDNDFNDAIFYVSANPIQSVIVSNIALPAYTTIDADNDGVTDNFDDFPTDPSKAFNNYYPSQNTVGTLAYEDLWPSKGDYDFNDLVVDYNFNPITNAQNQVVQIKATITTKAIGASYHSGFGIQLPISPNLVASVTGTDVRGNMIIKNSNGTEAGQSKATIILFDDAYTQLPWPGGGTGVNTTLGAPYVQPKTLNLVITLTTPISATTLGLPPYNPFIFTNKNRANEVHLINQPPTDLANLSLLGTQSDNSNPATGRYYVTSKNLPFAIDITGPFEYPVEKKVITDSHLKFYQWGVSGGSQYKDWYKSLTNYRNQTNIFTH
jgi:LruC domain-containing protein